MFVLRGLKPAEAGMRKWDVSGLLLQKQVPGKGILGHMSYKECVLTVGLGGWGPGWADGAEPGGDICLLTPQGLWKVKFQ